MNKFILLLLIFPLSSCIQVAQHFRDHIISNPGMSKAINVLDYQLVGTIGPDVIWVENKYNLRVRLPFDLVKFPQSQDIEDLMLNPSEVESLRKQSTNSLRNYFGSHKEIQLITLKKVSHDKRSSNYLLDAKVEHRSETLAEMMVKNGYYLVNEDLSYMSSYKHLLKIQEIAQRSRIGIWKKISSYNPIWHD